MIEQGLLQLNTASGTQIPLSTFFYCFPAHFRMFSMVMYLMQSAFPIQRIPHWHISFLAGYQRLQGVTARVGLLGYLGVTFPMIASTEAAGLRRSSQCPMCVCVCVCEAVCLCALKPLGSVSCLCAMHPVRIQLWTIFSQVKIFHGKGSKKMPSRGSEKHILTRRSTEAAEFKTAFVSWLGQTDATLVFVQNRLATDTIHTWRDSARVTKCHKGT